MVMKDVSRRAGTTETGSEKKQKQSQPKKEVLVTESKRESSWGTRIVLESPHEEKLDAYKFISVIFTKLYKWKFMR